ncbi:MAG: NAD(P)H-quinone oxidoreductase, partial [Ardenticatenaceae bacterium]
TALNRADLAQREGNYPPPPGAPPYPGLECAGTIRSVGENVIGWRPGQRVMALLGGGGYAERVAVPEETVMPVPDSLSLAEAAAIPEAWLTAYSNMIQIGRLAAGERVLIHAGASGVGSAAIQLAKWRGATVWTTTSEGKVEQVKALGVDYVINYQETNFADRIEETTGGEGVNLIIDFIGAPYWQDNLRALALWGRLVLVGLLGGAHADVNLGLFLAKKLSVHGSTLRDRTLEQKGQLVQSFTRDVLPAFADGTLHPVLDPRPFHLSEIAAAHHYMEENRNVGKIVVAVG